MHYILQNRPSKSPIHEPHYVRFMSPCVVSMCLNSHPKGPKKQQILSISKNPNSLISRAKLVFRKWPKSNFAHLFSKNLKYPNPIQFNTWEISLKTSKTPLKNGPQPPTWKNPFFGAKFAPSQNGKIPLFHIHFHPFHPLRLPKHEIASQNKITQLLTISELKMN